MSKIFMRLNWIDLFTNSRNEINPHWNNNNLYSSTFRFKSRQRKNSLNIQLAGCVLMSGTGNF